jgi:lysophospholipid acyltransferase (LPLAT)-like uncharacterized protein
MGGAVRIPFHRGLLGFIGSVFIRLLGLTWRIEWRDVEHLERAREMSGQVIFSFWHGRLLVLSYSHRGRKIQVLASEHPDGDLMGRTIAWLGFGHLKGSSTRGGARALRDLSSVLRRGFDIGLTVDGPRGPRAHVQQGAIELSRMTGSAVVPVSNAGKSRKLFRSWDVFQFPGPFAKVIVAYAEPFVVPSDASEQERERYRLRLEASLTKLTTDLDIALGYNGLEVWPHESL